MRLSETIHCPLRPGQRLRLDRTWIAAATRAGMSSLSLPLFSRFRYDDERLSRPHDDRLHEVHPAAFANGRIRQQVQPLATVRVDLVHHHSPSGLDALQVATWNDPVVGEAE